METYKSLYRAGTTIGLTEERMNEPMLLRKLTKEEQLRPEGDEYEVVNGNHRVMDSKNNLRP